MKLRTVLIVSLPVVMAAPLWAWPYMQDEAERKATYAQVVTDAMAAAERALQAGEVGKARYPL